MFSRASSLSSSTARKTPDKEKIKFKISFCLFLRFFFIKSEFAWMLFPQPEMTYVKPPPSEPPFLKYSANFFLPGTPFNDKFWCESLSSYYKIRLTALILGCLRNVEIFIGEKYRRNLKEKCEQYEDNLRKMSGKCEEVFWNKSEEKFEIYLREALYIVYP